MKRPPHSSIRVSLEMGMIAFFTLAALSLLVVYLADPALYAPSRSLTSSHADRYPVPVTLFLVGILALIALLILGIVRNFRWVFWLMLVAFAGSALQIPVILLQIADVLPSSDPLWYNLFRMGSGVVELALAVWMIHVYRNEGVWAMGRKKAEQVSHLARTKQGLIEYRSVGQGPAVLVLNGGHTNCHSPLGHETFFREQGYQLIVPSRPGYGRSASSTGKTADAFADPLVRFVDCLQLHQGIVVGISAA